MLRHIVVEGPDGAGKTTLIDKIVKGFGYVQHPRASRSVEGPVADLDQWVVNDLNGLGKFPPSIFDRHPLISEPIYGPICRGKVPGNFNQTWWVNTMRARLACHALVILCLPPFDIVKDQATKAAQMPGVLDNLPRIYDAYQRMTWVGVQMRYDRTRVDWMSMAPVLRQVVQRAR